MNEANESNNNLPLDGDYLSIMHFSDLHFGDYSILSQDDLKKNVKDSFFTLTISFLEQFIKKNSVNLVVFSGDYCSRNNFETEKSTNNPYGIPELLHEFLEIFISSSIPIILTIGNHDRNLKLDDEYFRYQIYHILFSDKFVQLNSKKSLNFEKDFINFKVFPKNKLLVFSAHSNEYPNNHIELNINHIRAFFKTLEHKYQQIDDFLKIIVIHHPFEAIFNNRTIRGFFKQNNIIYIFSGHEHESYCSTIDLQTTREKVYNYLAGSLFLNKERRDEKKLVKITEPQFNYYQILNENEYKIDAWYYTYDGEGYSEKKFTCSNNLHKKENNYKIKQSSLEKPHRDQEKWQGFYDRMKNTDPKHLGIDIQHLLNNKIRESDFENVLKMNVGARRKYLKIYYNQEWHFSFTNNRMGGDHYEIFVRDEITQRTYDFFGPSKNKDVLKKWLEHILKYCIDATIIIKEKQEEINIIKNTKIMINAENGKEATGIKAFNPTQVSNVKVELKTKNVEKTTGIETNHIGIKTCKKCGKFNTIIGAGKLKSCSHCGQLFENNP